MNKKGKLKEGPKSHIYPRIPLKPIRKLPPTSLTFRTGRDFRYAELFWPCLLLPPPAFVRYATFVSLFGIFFSHFRILDDSLRLCEVRAVISSLAFFLFIVMSMGISCLNHDILIWLLSGKSSGELKSKYLTKLIVDW